MADKPKKPRGRPKSDSPKGRTPKYVVHAGIDPKIGQAIDQFIGEQRLKPTMTSLVELCFIEFLEREGFWPPKSEEE